MRRLVAVVAALLVSTPLLMVSGYPAAGVTTGYAAWDQLSGSGGDYRTGMQLPAGGFPAATVTSDSRAPAAIPSGATAWLSPGTPVGARYGSSQGMAYLNLRPAADTAGSPSTTTYTFESPTPPGGWTLVLGDIDADQVTVSATNAEGAPVEVADLGFVGVFNYCDATPKPSSCSPGQGADLPTWNPATATLIGNAGAADTTGASGWFEPRVSLSSLTLVFERRSGFPVYQTWFASIAYDIAGSVSVVPSGGGPPIEPIGGVAIRLLGPDGSILATATTATDGTYVFPAYTAAPGYVVEIERPPGYAIEGLATQSVDLREGDRLAVDFAVSRLGSVAGTVTVRGEEGDAPLQDVSVRVTGPGDGSTVLTNADGTYHVGDLPPGDYTAELMVPDGFEPAGPSSQSFTITEAAEDVTGQDFVLEPAAYEVSGAVEVDREPLPDVAVVFEDDVGEVVERTVSGADGSFGVELVSGTYTAVIAPPAGYAVSGPMIQRFVVAGSDVVLAPFELLAIGPLPDPPRLPDTAMGHGRFTETPGQGKRP